MPKRVLVVEDDDGLVELLRFNLTAAGFSVAAAKDGIEGLNQARSVLPDVILLDLRLPDLDGFAVCEFLKEDPNTAAIPIIMVTAMSGELSRIAGLESGAHAYLTKPFSFKHLIGQIEETLTSTAGREGSGSSVC